MAKRPSIYEQLCMRYDSYRTYKQQHPEATHGEILGKGMIIRDWQRYYEDLRQYSIEQKRLAHPVQRRQRFRILKRDGYQCQICGRGTQEDAVLHVDHKIARAKGGTSADENLWTLCDDCNLGKGTSPL